MRRSKRALAVALAAFAASAAVLAVSATAGPARPHSAKAAFKVAWIYVGPHNDAGWSQAHQMRCHLPCRSTVGMQEPRGGAM